MGQGSNLPWESRATGRPAIEGASTTDVTEKGAWASCAPTVAQQSSRATGALAARRMRITFMSSRMVNGTHAPYLKNAGKKNSRARDLTGGVLPGGLQGAAHFNFDADDVVDLEQEIAGVLDAPLDVGHIEFCSALPGLTGEFGVDKSNDVVVGAVDGKGAVDFDFARTTGRDNSFNLSGAEDGFGEFGGFQDFLVHAVIAGVVAAFAALGVYDDFASSLAGGGIEIHRAAGDVEGAMHGVESGGDGVVDFRLGGIEGQRNWRGYCRRRSYGRRG